MRLGFVIATTGTGGMERYVLRLLAVLPRDIEPVLFVRSGMAGSLHRLFAESGAELHYTPLGYANPLRFLATWRLFRRSRLNAIVDLTGVLAGPTLMLARLAGIPRRAVFHRRSSFAFRPTPSRLAFARFSLHLVERSANAVLANSRAALQAFHPRLKDDPRCAVIANIINPAELQPSSPKVDLRRAASLPEDCIVALHVGRVDPAKDHATLLRALLLAMAQMPKLHAMLVGPGTADLHRELVELGGAGLEDRFRFLGDRADIADLYAASDLFVFPSVTEGQPNALLEAMICGLPVVASDIPSIREVVPERGWALLVPPRDPARLAQAILASAGSGVAAAERTYRDEAQRLTDAASVVPALLDSILHPGTGSRFPKGSTQ